MYPCYQIQGKNILILKIPASKADHNKQITGKDKILSGVQKNKLIIEGEEFLGQVII